MLGLVGIWEVAQLGFAENHGAYKSINYYNIKICTLSGKFV